MSGRPIVIVMAALLLQVALAAAQEAVFTDSATHPSAGALLARQQFQFRRIDGENLGADEIDEYTALTRLAYGISGRIAATLDIPVTDRHVGGPVAPGHSHGGGTSVIEDGGGLEDITLGLKWRVFQHDFGPIDTMRVSLIAGVEAPAGADDFSSDSWDPIVGGVFTYIHGRHGVDAALRWKLNTGEHDHPTRGGMGDDDALFYDAAYLFRLWPRSYEQTSRNAGYVVLEVNGVYEANGDNEVLLSPGLMLEAKGFALELGVQVPLVQEVDERGEIDFALVVGLRVLF